MSDITKEYLDKSLSQVIKTVDKRLNKAEIKLIKRFDNPLVEQTKHFDSALVAQSILLEKKIEKETHGLATMVAKGFDEVERRLDLSDRVEKLEDRFRKIETALNIN